MDVESAGSVSADAALESEDVAEASCYLLEFSVGSGGSRLGDVFVAADLAGVREIFERRYKGATDLIPYHVMWYGAVLHLWVVQGGSIVEGIDLRTQLRSGDPACDRTLARVVALQERDHDDERAEEIWEDVDAVIEENNWDAAPTLPLLGRVFELHDRIDEDPDGAETAQDELDAIREAIDEGTLPRPDGSAPQTLTLDWDAMAASAPALADPLLASSWVTVAWAGDPIRVKDSYLCHDLRGSDSGRIALHVGCNDLESGEDEWPQDG
ncbi:hypothetical protein GCM10023196_081270 [Actinoallomurus vinaceus]|uniref:DUF2262 domain-containing protein n=1 Tax=Actinoallomurus vinaceus TaxID=1080074 RepID=A0ABP8UQ04_9ACTN